MFCYYLKKGIISSLLLSCLLLIVYPDLYVYFMCLYSILFLTITQSSNCVFKTTDGDCGLLANTMNDFFVSVSDHLPRLNKSHKVFNVNEELPDQYVISVYTTFKALESVKANKATGPENIPAWVLRNYANVLAPPLIAIFNNSLREGVLPMEWKMANVILLPKTSPLCRLKKTLDQFH